MDYQGFLDAVRNLNENSYFYGNEVLYRMAAESDLTDKDQLAGMMWLIGRSYAASPQRRSYGTDKKTNWPVRSDNDGRDQFFASVAKHIVENNDLKFLAELKKPIHFDDSDADKVQLATSIKAVLEFNSILSKAIQDFDYAPDGETSNDHISFCSKLLHFYFPHSVFIIDTYAQNGGINLYNPSSMGYLCYPGNPDTYNALKMQGTKDSHFDGSVYDVFQKNAVNACIEKIKAYESRLSKPDAKQYVIHCVRSYLLGCLLKYHVIKPCSQMADGSICSMPRLIDTVFLNVKGKLTKDEAERHLKALKKYKEAPQDSNAYKKYKENEQYLCLLAKFAGGSTK